jgi:hypothetical protein
VVRVYPEKLDDQLTIAHRPLTHLTGRAQWVHASVVQAFGHGCLRAFDNGDYGLGTMADE